MIRLLQTELQRDESTALNAHLFTTSRRPRRWLPSHLAAFLAATAPTTHPVRERASMRMRFKRRHGAAVAKAPLN